MVICLLALAICALPAMAQKTTTGIDCSQISALNLLKQDNMRAGLTLIECGIVQGGQRLGGGDIEYPAPPNILVSNRSCSSPTACTKSESMVWAHPVCAAGPGTSGVIVVAFNDHDTTMSNTYGGVSASTDCGLTFNEIEPNPVATGHAQNFGDPIVVYNKKLAMWFTGDLVTGCGGQGIGLWSSPNGLPGTWSPGACAHTNSSDDRESMWVDNDPTSVGYGRIYISFNNFNIGGGALQVVYSDDGTTWTGPVTLNPTFLRDVQVTGALVSPLAAFPTLASYNAVFVASMNEGGGGLSNRTNVMWHSYNGGVSWTSSLIGAPFAPPGDGVCSSNSYFAKMNPIWRHMGWGGPAVGPNGVVHYDYAAHGQGSDNGDIFYVRSTDNGQTWSAPFLLNTDTPGVQYHTQFMPSLSVNGAGKVTASWYDRRSVSSACSVATDPGCNYERFGRQSADNGATWGASDFAISTAIIPQPQQQDPGVQSCYAGDYDYATAQGGTAYVTWTDGRRSVGGVQVQDVDFAAVPEQ
jgi:hypothetical protein